MDINPEKDLTGEYIEVNKGYAGYKYPEDVNKWFATAIDADVVALRSSMKRTVKLKPQDLFDKKDVRKTFTSDAAFHIIAQASVEDLGRRIEERYPDGLENNYLSTETFRPNIVFDTDMPYEEDEFFEMRVGSALFRNCGPCKRCDTIRTNLDTHK